MEDKELLLKDLCTRLPYGVIVEDRYGVRPLTQGNTEFVNLFSGKCNIKPYLFPLSSMTREQKNQLLKISGIGSCIIRKDNITFCSNIDLCALEAIFDFLDRNHFDYRGLIGKGLAIDATELNIY